MDCWTFFSGSPLDVHVDCINEYLRVQLGDAKLARQVLAECSRRMMHTPYYFPYPSSHTGILGGGAYSGLPSASPFGMEFAHSGFATPRYNLSTFDESLAMGIANMSISSPTNFALLADAPPFEANDIVASYPPWTAENHGTACIQGHDNVQPRTNGATDEMPSTSSSACAPIPLPVAVVERLDQGTYACKQAVKHTPVNSITFNGELGVLLSALESLEHGDQPAFPHNSSIGERPSLRFKLPGFEDFSTQIRVRPCRGGRPKTLHQIAALVRDELRKLMDHAEGIGKPLQHQGTSVPFEHIVLLRIDHVSQGSLQPILGVRGGGAGT